MIPSEVAAISAPPKPWMPRATISTSLVGARPPSSDANEKMISAATNVRRWPYTSPTRPASISMPPNTIAYALTTQLRSAEEKFSPTWIDGSATLTIPRSRITMNCATQQTASSTALDWIRAGLGAGGGGVVDCSGVALVVMLRRRAVCSPSGSGSSSKTS
jgi:hypothetical protein